MKPAVDLEAPMWMSNREPTRSTRGTTCVQSEVSDWVLRLEIRIKIRGRLDPQRRIAMSGGLKIRITPQFERTGGLHSHRQGEQVRSRANEFCRP